MTERRTRQVVGDARRWKALGHPLRGAMLAHLDTHGPANSTTLADALGESTGTTSYHLRVLADADVIEEIPERARGRERWWRAVATEHREPDYDTLDPTDRAALDAWREQQLPGERALFERFLAEYRAHGPWAKAARVVNSRFTEQGLRAVFDGFLELVDRHGHGPEDAPEGARAVDMRLFYLPTDPPPA